MDAIEIEKLRKSYDDVTVLRGLDLRVPSGCVYGLLGPNGAGKSTLIHLLLGFIKPSSGRIRLLGSLDPEQVRGRVGYLPERLRYHLRYAGREYLRYLGSFDDLAGARLEQRVDEVLRVVGLLDAADRMLGTYSKGMLQRLGIAQALLIDPEVLLIDEPTSGLDPAGQREVIDLLSFLRQQGRSILLATHLLDEAEQLCDRVGILFDGVLAAEVDAEALRKPGANVVIDVARLPVELASTLEQLSPAVRCNERTISIRPNDPALQGRVLRVLLDADLPIISLRPQGRPLEELYLAIVQGEPPGAQLPPPAPQAPVAVAPRRPGTGDTLLRELLQGHEPPPDQEAR